MLLNPAVDPARDLVRHIGDQTLWHDPAEHFHFRPEYIAELRALEVGPLARPEQVFAVIAKGDEVLDWRDMSARYPGSRHQAARRRRPRPVGLRGPRTCDEVLAFIDPV